MKKENGVLVMEYKSVPFDLIECKEETIKDIACFKFKGYASTFGNIDYGDDVCVKGCFTKAF